MKKQVKEWIKFADTDLRSAKKLLEDKTLTQSAAFHVHQSIEKSFKAVIENLDINIPKIHDLEKLLEIIQEKEIHFKTETDPILKINNIYIEARYPGDQGLVPSGIPTTVFVKGIYEFANSLFKEINELLEEE